MIGAPLAQAERQQIRTVLCKFLERLIGSELYQPGDATSSPESAKYLPESLGDHRWQHSCAPQTGTEIDWLQLFFNANYNL